MLNAECMGVRSWGNSCGWNGKEARDCSEGWTGIRLAISPTWAGGRVDTGGKQTGKEMASMSELVQR